MKIVIFGGTSEGRELSCELAKAGAEVIVSVASEYGVEEQGAAEGVRVEVDDSAEKLGAKIREASAWKVPYKLVVGPRDEAAGTVSVRKSGEGDLGAMSLDDFVAKIRGELEP